VPLPTNHSSSQKTGLSDRSYGIKIWTDLSSLLSEFTRLSDRRTDGRTRSSLVRADIPWSAEKLPWNSTQRTQVSVKWIRSDRIRNPSIRPNIYRTPKFSCTFWSKETRNILLSFGAKHLSISWTVRSWFTSVTDRRTDFAATNAALRYVPWPKMNQTS